MAVDKEAAKNVLDQIVRDELAQLGCDLTSIPSPNGREKAIGEFILNCSKRTVEPRVQSAQDVYQHPFGKKIKPETPDSASIWTDTKVYNERGIPAIKIGPRGRHIGPRNEEIEIDTMVNAAKLYTLMALDICTRERPRI